jgi:hypothetical protein
VLVDGDYTRAIDSAVQGAVSHGASTFAELCRRSRGAFPTEVADSLRRITDRRFFGQLLATAEDDPDGDSSYEAWPDPSPTDYEWRFTSSTASHLAARAVSVGSPVVCIGAPTVFARLSAIRAAATLVDRNDATTALLGRQSANPVVIADVAQLQNVGIGRLGAIVMDPPWSPKHILYWINQALKIAAPNGVIFMPLFQDLVRPSALDERREIIAYVNRFGSTELIRSGVMYETPLFEREALAGLALPPLPSWRVADLLVIRLHGLSEGLEAPAPLDDNWCRYSFGRQIVAVKQSSELSAGHIALSSVDGTGAYLMKSVSSRAPYRHRIGLWTSRNRVAEVSGGFRLQSFLSAVSNGQPSQELVSAFAATKQEREALMLLGDLIGW